MAGSEHIECTQPMHAESALNNSPEGCCTVLQLPDGRPVWPQQLLYVVRQLQVTLLPTCREGPLAASAGAHMPMGCMRLHIRRTHQTKEGCFLRVTNAYARLKGF